MANKGKRDHRKEMIGEIESRSAYIMKEVETHSDFIQFFIKEVENTAFSNIEDLISFVKRLDEKLSFLVDRRAVLKNFYWPAPEAMREAAFAYCDLYKLESDALSFRNDPEQPCSSTIIKMQTYWKST